MLNHEIRPLRPADASEIAAFLQRVETFRRADIECALEDIEDWLSSRDKTGTRFLCCLRDNRIAGFVCWDRVPIARGTYELAWICTNPCFARMGVGAAMVRAVERELKGRRARLMVVETSSGRPYEGVRQFLRKSGFIRAARIRDFWADGEDKIVFEKRLGQERGVR